MWIDGILVLRLSGASDCYSKLSCYPVLLSGGFWYEIEPPGLTLPAAFLKEPELMFAGSSPSL